MATSLHCAYCFDTLISSVDGGHHSDVVSSLPNSDAKFPLFVTWKKRHSASSSDWRLRGCIGTFSPRELARGLKDYALISALKDSRFSPIRSAELSSLRCDVSLLTNFENAAAVDDWTLGVHGVTIDFKVDSESYGSTFLPEVPPEQGWSKAKTLEALIEKSGYPGSASKLAARALKDAGLIKLTRYQSSKASLTYDEYAAMRNKKASPPKAEAASSEEAAAEKAHNGTNGANITNGARANSAVKRKSKDADEDD